MLTECIPRLTINKLTTLDIKVYTILTQSNLTSRYIERINAS